MSDLPAPASTGFLTDEPSPRIAPEGRPIVAGFVLVGAVLSFVAIVGLHRVGLEVVGYIIAGLSGVISVWCAWFFRDPVRRTPADPLAVICPADGRVVMIGPAPPPADLQVPAEAAANMIRIAVFMNVFNVHVNRSPVAGLIRRVSYHPGKFFNAALDKASLDNERFSLLLERADGRLIASVQIAGLIARRIVWRVAEGDALAPGQRYGLIRFGSRVDVYVPADAEVLVKIGDRPVAGETVLARLPQASSVP